MATPLSTVFRGRAFEERCQRVLHGLSMSLRRVGGPSDGGIDLQGYWWLPPARSNTHGVAVAGHPTLPRRLRVLAQCKAERAKLSTVYVREMEGVVYHLQAQQRLQLLNSDTPENPHLLANVDSSLSNTTVSTDLLLDDNIPMVALIASESAFTKPTLIRAHSSPIPFLLLHLPPSLPQSSSPHDMASDVCEPDTAHALGSAFWNAALGGSFGLLRGQFELRWERSANDGVGRPGLWQDGMRVENHIPGADIDPPNLHQGHDTS